MSFFQKKSAIKCLDINNFQINCFLSITLKFILSLVSRGLGALQGNFGTGVQLKLRKHPNDKGIWNE
jgi:ABC-type microcin C transport system permease subunit YejE